MSVLDSRIFQSNTKSNTHFCLKDLHRFIIKYDSELFQVLKLGGTITDQFKLDKNDYKG